jgi:rubrerythrin
MDTTQYIANNGKSYRNYGSLRRDDSPECVSDKAGSMGRRHMLTDRTGARKVEYLTCDHCGTAHQAGKYGECPYCGRRAG